MTMELIDVWVKVLGRSILNHGISLEIWLVRALYSTGLKIKKQERSF